MENPVFCLVRFLQLAAFEMQEEGVKRDMMGEDFQEAPLSHLRCQLSTRHALRVPYRGAYISKGSLVEKSLPFRGGEPPAGGGGVLREIFCLM